MDLRTLRYFIAVLEAGSLSRAAGSLYVAQPALTAQIKKLEGQLGAQLFERSHTGVTPTPAGLQLYQDARRLLSDADAVRERIQRLPQGPEGSVTIAVPFLLASLLMGPLLQSLKKSMLDRRADIGVLVDLPQVDGLHCRPLAQEAMYFCGQDLDGSVRARLLQSPSRDPLHSGTHPALGPQRPTIDFADAAALPLVLQSRRFSIRQRVEEAAMRCGVPLNIAHEQDSVRVIRSLYSCGAGFTFTPACSLYDTAAGTSPDWIIARVTQPDLLRSYTLATAADREPDGATAVVLQALQQQVRTLTASGQWEAQSLLVDGP
jgi:LysR family nitrogen assimilation transcriptional regulator